MERGRRDHEAVVVKKGPWTAEEDEILVEYVNKHGPRDWSSIRSKGLLPRSGKSCRLRWVNKLRPDLKTGCKFSTEEERIVIELQARFGNKWARIATYLQGRTDNDVKNFWSTRQKRLARIQQTTPQKKPQGNNDGMLPVFSEAPLSQVPGHGFFQCGEEEPSNGECSKVSNNPDSMNATNMLDLQEQVRSNMPNPLQQDIIDRKPCLLDTQLPQFNFPQLPQALLDLPLLPEDHDLSIFQDPFTNSCSNGYDLFPDVMPFLGLEDGCSNTNMDDGIPNTPESFFDDFPVDMLDYTELPPPPPPQPPTSSDCYLGSP